jgi:hypothetical protein
MWLWIDGLGESEVGRRDGGPSRASLAVGGESVTWTLSASPAVRFLEIH